MNTFISKSSQTKRYFSCVLFLFASLLATGLVPENAAAEITTVRIQEHAQVEGDDILLGRIAEIDGDNASLREQLKRIIIGKAPLPGQSIEFDRRDVMRRMAQYEVDFSAVRVMTPRQIKVMRSFVEITKPELEKIVSEFIAQSSPISDGARRIKEIKVPESVILPKGRVTYKVVGPQNRRLVGRCPLAVEFSVNGHSHKKVWTSVTIEVLGTVVLTRKPLGRFKPITEDDIVLQTMDLANLPHDVVTRPETVLGKRTKRAIGTQIPLRTNLVELPPLVNRGDIVVIVAESRGLKITAQGQVKRKGRLGERIPVVNVDSNKVLYARVIDANTVQVDLQ